MSISDHDDAKAILTYRLGQLGTLLENYDDETQAHLISDALRFVRLTGPFPAFWQRRAILAAVAHVRMRLLEDDAADREPNMASHVEAGIRAYLAALLT